MTAAQSRAGQRGERPDALWARRWGRLQGAAVKEAGGPQGLGRPPGGIELAWAESSGYQRQSRGTRVCGSPCIAEESTWLSLLRSGAPHLGQVP